MRRVGLILLGLALVLLVGRVGLGFLRAPDDAQLIREALAEATKAAREGRPGGVLENISQEVSLNGQSYGGSVNTREIADRIRKASPDLQLKNTNATVTGDEARVVTPASLSLGFLNARISIPFEKVTITLKKEEDRDFLIIPTHRWRVTGIEISDEEAQRLQGAFGSSFGG